MVTIKVAPIHAVAGRVGGGLKRWYINSRMNE